MRHKTTRMDRARPGAPHTAPRTPQQPPHPNPTQQQSYHAPRRMSAQEQPPYRRTVPERSYYSTTAHVAPTAGGAPSFAYTPPRDPRHTTSFPKPQRSSRRRIPFGRIILIGAAVVFCLVLVWMVWMFYTKGRTAAANMNDSDRPYTLRAALADIANPHSYEKLEGFADGRINILLLGRANTFKGGKDLTDTIMLASINTRDYRLGLFSIPRDLLVTHNKRTVKINSLYTYGLHDGVGTDYLTDTVTTITGEPVHYYILMDFEGFTKIIDILGGINIDVPNPIKDTRYPGPGYSYETFEVPAGLQHFDGATALKYARTRHDKEGDFGRAKRQQHVMQAARNKALSLGTIVNPLKIGSILDVLGDHVHTNVGGDVLEPLISLIKKVDTHNITTVVVDAWRPDSLLVSARTGGMPGLIPRIGTYREIRERAGALFELEKIAQRQKDIAAEQPTITLINRSDNAALPARVTAALATIGFTSVTLHTPPRPRTGDVAPASDATTITDLTDGEKPFSLDELIKKLPAAKSADAFDADTITTDFVITLGTDLIPTYTYTAISQDEMEKEWENTLSTNPHDDL